MIIKTGLLNQNIEEMLLHATETVEFKASLFQRLFNVGTIRVTGTGESDVVFKNITNPMEIKRRLDDIVVMLRQNQRR